MLLILFWMISLMTISLSFKFHKNPSCLKVSRSLLKNDDAQLEFRRTWRFLTGAGVLDHIVDGLDSVCGGPYSVPGVPDGLFPHFSASIYFCPLFRGSDPLCSG